MGAVSGDIEATDLFLSLTPERVLEAVARSGLEPNPVCYPLNSFENRVYEVELADRSRVIAKFYRPGRWDAEQILEEHRFLEELAAEQIPVCTVLPFPDGTTLHQIEGIYYGLSERRGGRAPDEMDDDTVVRLGMLTARLHNVGARRDTPSRLRLTAENWVHESLRWLEEQDAAPAAIWPRFQAAARAIAAAAEERLKSVATHRLHGDLHHGNILFRDDRLRLLDFDDLCVGPAVQDMWLALPGRGEETRRRRALWISGYEQFRLFDVSTLRLVEPLRGLRMVHYVGWLARRYHDPAFQLAWPEFGSEEFWEKELRDLEEQVEHLDDAALGPIEEVAAASSEEESLLSNADYFWDWEED